MASSIDEKLRAEIMESEKSLADLVKWKSIAVAATASASLGFGSNTIESAKNA